MELVFEVIFNNENCFYKLKADEAKIILCTYKPAAEVKNIIEPIEIEKGIYLCDKVYNAVRDMIITAKLTVYKNKLYKKENEVNYDVNFAEITDEYFKSSNIKKEKFVEIIISDYLEFLKECSLNGGEKEDILMVSSYKKLLFDINIVIDEGIIMKYTDIITDLNDSVEYYISRMLEIQDEL